MNTTTSDNPELLPGDAPATEPSPPGLFRDLVTLAKPGITIMNVLMTAGTISLAPTRQPGLDMLGTLLATTLCVSSANALNMWVEREGDRHMVRTRNRPLPSGRIHPTAVLVGALLLGVLSVAMLAAYANALTAAIGGGALFLYVCVYTPMKRRSPAALLVGAIPGAAPPLIGWTAATNQIDAVGITLFLILALWQIPHFIAIAIYRKADYERAGIKVTPSVKGEETARIEAIVYSLLLVPVTLLLVPLGLAGYFYFVIASAAGAAFFIFSLRGIEPQSGAVWARKFFLATLVYLPLLIAALATDVLLFS